MSIETIRALKEMAKYPKEKSRKPIAKKSAKRIEQEKSYSNDNAMWDWFAERRKEMTGKCWHCGLATMKKDDEKYHFSIAHILPKNLFPSVATHPFNFIELCFWGKNCHGNMDNKTLDLMDMNCFNTIIERVAAMYPLIAKEERRRIPQILIDYIETEK